MFKENITQSKITPSKKNIKITDCTVENGTIVDDGGNIAGRVADALDGITDTFDIHISVAID